MMFDSHLFLAFPLDKDYLSKLLAVQPALRSLFIQEGDLNYLQTIEHDGQTYLVKNLGSKTDLATLESVRSHLLSILRRLIEDYPYESHPLRILAI